MKKSSAIQVAIIGGGPAGLAAALQLKRSGITPVLFEANRLGGLLENANLIENYLGFPQGISGVRLVALYKRQLRNFGLHIVSEQVTSLSFDRSLDLFEIQLATTKQWARSVIVATGTKPRLLDLETTCSPSLRRRIFYEGMPLRKCWSKEIVIIGSGDTAYDYALNLSPRNSIRIMSRGSAPKALPLLVERVSRSPFIQISHQSSLLAIESGPGGTMALLFQIGKRKVPILAHFLLVVIGRDPQKDFYAPDLAAQEDQLIAAERLFLVGDVRNGLNRQVAIATGNGVEAAMRICRSRMATCPDVARIATPSRACSLIDRRKT